ncbi:Uncharacterized protein, UPF0254 family [Desulfurobacterium pacificum]|uniref:Uncharacterized protein, UPF0254 family n=1 Tax=Desulfurobacterium pacificum TaxID=240166 RepID=A0ABY1NVY7_9BACT|nr:FeGP cofactor biosynthesis protein HcgF family protein [Desulfurobacterium pacificum]SMP19405.1 Uncharacterized protein, UPF0254 family [Desulfurobacterium pacificum]
MTFASAECFTHCQIGIKIHHLSAPYTPNPLPLKVVFAGFFPTVESAEKLLKIKLPKPQHTIKGIKVYDEKTDLEAAFLLARGVKDIFNAEIAIGSSAGIGRGAVVIIYNEKTYFLRSQVSANLLDSSAEEIKERSQSAAELTVKAIISLVKHKKIPPFLEALNWMK